MLTYKSISKNGDRQINEDSVGQYVTDSTALFVVADGLGGHGDGHIASHYVVEQFLLHYNDSFAKTPERYMSSVFSNIHSGLKQMQKEQNKDMKSTAAAIILSGNRITVCHIGDSRVYVCEKNKIIFQTLDHSVPQMLVRTGIIKEKNIRFHPDRNQLLRALGEDSDLVNLDIQSFLLPQNTKSILICSDGFWEYIDEREVLHTLNKNGNAEDWIFMMEEIVLKKGKNHTMDNYSAIGIFL